LPINNQHLVNGFFHKLLGENNPYHDTPSNYSLSSLRGGKLIENNEVNFENGGFILLSTTDQELLSKVLIGSFTNKNFYKDIEISGIEYLPAEKFYNGWNYFRTLTPILLEKNEDFITLESENFVKELTEQTIRKLKAVNPNLSLTDFEIKILSHPAHKARNLFIKKKSNKDLDHYVYVFNRASECHVNIFCNKETAELLYNLGLGKSTGCGFGMIFKTENKHLYY
jgi:CRISPR-associated endoribonuclease Cas6